jgi:hypothetical protein
MDVGVLIELAHQDGWDVCLIATPRVFQWLDVPGLAGRTSHPVRHDYKLPGEPDLLPEPAAIIVAPATFNTINKWAAGIADTLALGLLCEATGKGLPVVVLPYLNAAHGEHPALGEGIERLRGLGSGSCSVPRCCRCIGLVRASATGSRGTSLFPPSRRLLGTRCGNRRASSNSSATCSLEVALPLQAAPCGRPLRGRPRPPTPGRRAHPRCDASRLHGLTGQPTHFSQRYGPGSASRYARRVLETCTKTRTGRFRWRVAARACIEVRGWCVSRCSWSGWRSRCGGAPIPPRCRGSAVSPTRA